MSAPPTGRDRIRLRLKLIDWITEAALDAGGVEFIDRGEIAAKLQQGGLGRTASYDWIVRAIEDGDVERAIEARRAGLAAMAAGTHPDAPSTPTDALPPPPPGPPAEGVTFRLQSNALVAHLGRAVADVETVRRMAFTADGKPRNARLLLHASEALRKTLETALRVQSSLHEIAAVERLNRAIVSTIMEESPELARRVLQRLDQLCAHVESGGAV